MTPLVLPLADPAASREELTGGKAASLSRLVAAGFRVPEGFCLTVAAYETFLRESGIEQAIRLELGRKSLDGMRWEELWDAALRIRSAFLSRPLPGPVREAIRGALARLGGGGLYAVRSSAVGEDSGDRSYAGLHESVTDVAGEEEIEKAVLLVWSSLWSDAALLYRRELGLDPRSSRMAVVVQRMVHADRSGVAFGRDPRRMGKDLALVEAVPGSCKLLVDGTVDPDRWEIHRPTRDVIAWRAGERPEAGERAGEQAAAQVVAEPLLARPDLDAILDAVDHVESLIAKPPDVEWTGRAHALTILQARPITEAKPDPDADRQRSLSLRPGDARLRALREEVADRLIPRLKEEGRRMSEEALDGLDDAALAGAIERRAASLEQWMKVYWDVFIPFAHGVRRLATYYNDAVRPDDPYEFVGMLRNQPMIAAERNSALRRLAGLLRSHGELREALREGLETAAGGSEWPALRDRLARQPGGEEFLRAFDELGERFLDITFDRTRLSESPAPILRNLLRMALATGRDADGGTGPRADGAENLENRLLDAVGTGRHDEAREMIETGRISWKLRDDDNLLMARIESQLARAVERGAARLREAGRLDGDARPGVEDAERVVRALRDPDGSPVTLKARPRKATPSAGTPGAVRTPSFGETPRQLIGQPASPGMASGPARVVRGIEDLGRFEAGEVLVCDAIQPTMTHLAMLAAAIVERRGGMLVHGAIIAREMGIPCVNGVRDAARVLRDGDRVTVDGYLGIVTVGEPELDLETA